jgi:hypothetical protein
VADYAIGSHWNVADHGEVAVAGIVGVQIVVTQVPPTGSVRLGTPPVYHGLGHVNAGNADGFLEPESVRHITQLLYPLPPGITRLGWSLTPGTEATLTALLAVGSSWGRQPWDRNPIPVGFHVSTLVQPSDGSVVLASYTVPNGRNLYVATASVHAARWWTATAYNGAEVALDAGYFRVLYAITSSQIVGSVVSDSAAGAPLIFPPATQLVARALSYDSGGSILAQARFGGFTFDA